MPPELSTTSSGQAVGDRTYRRVLDVLRASQIPFLVGGAYAFSCYTGIERSTKDLDLFVLRADYGRLADALRDDGMSVELTFPHWLAKAWAGELFVDIIFNSGNGETPVDEDWFRHAGRGEILGVPVQVSPPEEQIWSKAFVMERERFDGADIAHLLHACGGMLDWHRLLQRFGAHWRVLLAHLTLYGFAYPGDRDRVPAWVIDRLTARLNEETHAPPPASRLCAGTLLSREQYLEDVARLGYQDARAVPVGSLTPNELAHWTAAIPDKAGLPSPGR